jgi:hypothetical protein
MLFAAIGTAALEVCGVRHFDCRRPEGRLHVDAGGSLTAKVTANEPDGCAVQRIPANLAAQAVGERGRLRLSANSVESA